MLFNKRLIKVKSSTVKKELISLSHIVVCNERHMYECCKLESDHLHMLHTENNKRN